jgi:hypothetical protein
MPSSKIAIFTAMKRKDKHGFYIKVRPFNIPVKLA